jgi:hypothetical protein
MESLNECRKTSIVFPRSSRAWSTARLFNCAAAKAISLFLISVSAHAIILFGTGDPEANTTPPPANLAANGWNLQGQWGQFQGTPIGPHHFITAAHVGGAIGDPFIFNGVTYTTTAVSADSATDLIIWTVSGTFSTWAELYEGPDETGADFVMFGRGATRGPEVRVDGNLKGWEWGAWDHRLRWGQNRVKALRNDVNHATTDLPLILAGFDSNAGTNEAHLAVGDSGGGVFIKQANAWRLAGINYAVDPAYSKSALGPGFYGAIFDEGGLYSSTAGAWVLTPDNSGDQSGSLYATRIKPRLTWIQSVLGSQLAPVLAEAPSVTGPFEAAANAVFDTTAKTVRVTPTAGVQFFRIENIPATITQTELISGQLVLHYQ